MSAPVDEVARDYRPAATAVVAGSARRARMERIEIGHAAPPETVTCLRAAIRAAHALGRLGAAFERSAVRDVATANFELLDIAGAIALERGPIDVARLLVMPDHQRDAPLSRSIAARMLARVECADTARGLSVDLLLDLDACETGGRRGVRRYGLGRVERATLEEGQRMPRGADVLGEGLVRWLTLLERDAHDVQSLVVIAAAHRRWLALRPFVSGNVVLAHHLSAALLQDEGWLPAGCVPLARWLAPRASLYRRRLHEGESDESGWIGWWLDALASAAEQALRQLTAWEAALVSLGDSPATRHAAVHSSSLVGIARPAVEHSAAIATSGLSRAAGARWLDGLVLDGVLRPLSGTRERRYVNVRIQSLLLSGPAP